MDKQQARDLIRETFERPFDKPRFIVFIKNLLHRIEDTSFTYQGQYIPDAYKPYINVLERIGKFNDGENIIDILIVRLNKETLLERARTMQRNFVAWYLNGSRGGNLKDAALVAFISPDEADWRFSLVKMDYKFEQTPSGKMKVKEEFTPARRWSFLVGANEKSHTAQSRLMPFLADDDHTPNLSKLEETFNIETVTKEFFLKYRDLFIRTKEALDTVVQNNPLIKTDFETKGVSSVNFAKKLLGQLIFLYFLQKKGWFGVGRDADWGTGSKNFLRELFDKKHGDYKNFFNDMLENLFYDALRDDRKHNDYYFSQLNCKIPFLNGGLFDPIGNYDWVHTDIILPDNLFSNKKITKDGDIGDGILDIFDRYNFTVKEDEPLEKEVAIDPELLGKAYEKFNAIRPDNFEEYKKALKKGGKGEETKFNKQYGVYYTPREIVHYMCQQSLINYLYIVLNRDQISYEKLGISNIDMFGNDFENGQLDLTIEHKENPIITKEDIEILIHFGESFNENDARVEIIGNETSTYTYQLPESIRRNAELIDQKLAEITVCDPAVGSGAFPVGMMSEIVKTRNVLSTFIKGVKRTCYDFKRRCIEHSLYGVDIDSGAVEIAKLRLWLSLVVDEDDIKNIKPLPNLDYKIVCGNSLLGYPYTPMGLEKIEIVKKQYFEEVNPSKKIELQSQINDAIYGLFKNTETSLGYKVTMDFRINYSEVFHERGGFDVIIANPPYVRADNPNFKNQRDDIKKNGLYETLFEKWDLFIPFIELGLKLLGNNGIFCYITSNSLLSSKFAFHLLDYIQQYYAPQFIDYFSDDSKVFEAGVVPVVFSLSKNVISQFVRKTFHKGTFSNITKQENILLSDFRKIGRSAFKLTPNVLQFAIKTVPLGEICYLSVGMVLNADEKRAKGSFKVDDLISIYPTNINTKRYIEAKDIENWVIKRVRYLEWETERCPVLIRRKTFPELYNRPKLMIGSITGGIYDDTGLLTHHGIVVFVRFFDLLGIKNKSISGSIKKFNSNSRQKLEKISEKYNLKYLLAILNSKFAHHFLNSIRRHRLKNYFYPDDFRNLPIADVPPNHQKPFIEIIENILKVTKYNDYLQDHDKQAQVIEYEKQIDQMVYDLYGLTDGDIAVVEGKQ